ncbi:hypothetical protein [Rhodococcus ruber]|uniref:hypothetical protein n=1 Tax=Rhodococcus ruber TaxID=1830 RepID=UPI00126826D1|nr:hypothetical protein [Rhodococcus ruber]
MSNAVVRVVIDPDGRLSVPRYRDGINSLRRRGFEVIAGPVENRPEREWEIELVVDAGSGGPETDELLAACREAFGLAPQLSVITYISRGTDEDAHGVLKRFGVAGEVRRLMEGGEEVVAVALSATSHREVAESRLKTALEAALNAEVRIVTAED